MAIYCVDNLCISIEKKRNLTEIPQNFILIFDDLDYEISATPPPPSKLGLFRFLSFDMAGMEEEPGVGVGDKGSSSWLIG